MYPRISTKPWPTSPRTKSGRTNQTNTAIQQLRNHHIKMQMFQPATVGPRGRTDDSTRDPSSDGVREMDVRKGGGGAGGGAYGLGGGEDGGEAERLLKEHVAGALHLLFREESPRCSRVLRPAPPPTPLALDAIAPRLEQDDDEEQREKGEPKSWGERKKWKERKKIPKGANTWPFDLASLFVSTV